MIGFLIFFHFFFCSGVKQMGYKFGLDLMGSKMVMDSLWEEFSPENSAGVVPDDLQGYRTKFQGIHQHVHQVHNQAEEPFEDLAVAAKSILDPMMKLMEIFMKKEGAMEKRVCTRREKHKKSP